MAQIPHARESERECTRAQMLRQGTDRLESQSMGTGLGILPHGGNIPVGTEGRQRPTLETS